MSFRIFYLRKKNNIYVGLISTNPLRKLTVHLSDSSSIAHLKKSFMPDN